MDFTSFILLTAVALFIAGYILQKHRADEEARKAREARLAAFEAAWGDRFWANPEDPLTRALASWFKKTDYQAVSDFERLTTAWEKAALLVSAYPELVEARLADTQGLEKTLLQTLLKGKPAPDEKARLAYNRRRNFKEAERARDILTSPSGRTPNTSQSIAAVDLDDRTLVLAGAGTGKTATIVAKTRYLVKTGLVHPSEILLLAYNRDAAEEMRERLTKELGDGGVDVRTFHSFGNAILKADTAEKRSVSAFLEQPILFNQFVVDIVKALCAKDPAYAEALVTFFVEHAAPLEVESSFETPLEHTLFVRSHDLTTLGGERVKSGGELVIANLLNYWQVPYAYEARYPVKAFAYKPDFLVSDKPFTGTGGRWKNNFSTVAPDAKTAWIEYFGIDSAGRTAPWIDTTTYKLQRERKIALHREKGTTLIELTTADLTAGHLKAKLKLALETAGIPVRPIKTQTFCNELLTDDTALSPRWQGFLTLVRTFLPLLKESGLTPAELKAEAQSRGLDTDRFAAFWIVFEPILSAYEAHLAEENALDFGDMIVEAARKVEAGMKLPYKFILVDEFQDISRSRARLLSALLAAGNGTKLFAVGDDWQSIYRFSGSDTRYVSAFEKFFGRGTVLQLDTTYRYPEELHDLTADFVTRNPAQLKKILHSLKPAGYPCALMRDVRSLVPCDETMTDEEKTLKRAGFPASRAYRIAIEGYLTLFSKKARERDGQMNRVMLLGRRRWENMPALRDCPTVAQLRKRFPDLDIHYRTVHAAKGLEADYVIMVGNDAEVFPSEREGDQIIEAVLPISETYPFAEERRLFYVAMTRAKHFLVILYDGERESLFMSELRETASPELLKRAGEESHPRCPHCGLGLLSKKVRDGKPYYVCTNSATCGQFFPACPDCGSALAENDTGRYCLNPDCSHLELHCPKCGIGFLRERRQKATGHAFFGCSLFGNDDGLSCDFTESVEKVGARRRVAEKALKLKARVLKR